MNWVGCVGVWMVDIILLLFGLLVYWLIVLFGWCIVVNYCCIMCYEVIFDELEWLIGWFIEIFVFVLVVFVCDGIEVLCMWLLKV